MTDIVLSAQAPEHTPRTGLWRKTGPELIGGLLVIIGLYLVSLYSYLLLHTLVELFSIAVALAIFMLVWNAWAYMDNSYLKYLGMSVLFIGGLDLVHTLAYKGMNIFAGYDANLPTQLWIAARYLQALTLFIAPYFLRHPVRRSVTFGVYSAIFIAVLILIFTGIFPVCFIEGSGLTPFKIISEYIISLILAASVVRLYRQRTHFSQDVFRWLVIAILLTIGSELAFTFYISVYGFSNLVGHVFKILAFYYIYKAIIQTGLARPYHLLFRELKLQEVQLKQARDAAESANKAKSVFLANMSHELRSPLNIILGFARLTLHNQDIPPAEKENLTAICRSGEHLLALINNVLDMSKIEAGQSTLNENIFNLTALLNELEFMLQPKVIEKRLQLVFSRETDLPATIRTDENKLRQVLLNLLGNAVKFTEAGVVKCYVKNAPSGPGKLHFEVSDTGPGIPAAETETIFEPFVQTQVGRAVTEGTGLGLSISRNFVQLMGGDITVDSEVGRGTTITFEIAAQTVANSERDNDVSANAPIIALAPGRPPSRILVADDQLYNRQLLVKILTPLGFDLREAGNGQEALEIWKAWQPHLIWMDMRMPVMDGYQATRQIKSTGRGQATVVIALTAGVPEEERPLVFSAGCDDFVRKPFQEADIFDTLQKHLGVKHPVQIDETTPPPTAGEPASGWLTPADLASLPESRLAELRQAARRNDPAMAEAIIEQVRHTNPTTAAALAELVNRFRFDELLQLLRGTDHDRLS